MRLTKSEKKIIIECAKKIFGANTHLILFGSRVSDTSRGGDIDLLLIPEDSISNDFYNSKIQFLVEVKNKLGDQKIDIIIQKPRDTRGIISTAQQNGIALC